MCSLFGPVATVRVKLGRNVIAAIPTLVTNVWYESSPDHIQQRENRLFLWSSVAKETTVKTLVARIWKQRNLGSVRINLYYFDWIYNVSWCIMYQDHESQLLVWSLVPSSWCEGPLSSAPLAHSAAAGGSEMKWSVCCKQAFIFICCVPPPVLRCLECWRTRCRCSVRVCTHGFACLCEYLQVKRALTSYEGHKCVEVL